MLQKQLTTVNETGENLKYCWATRAEEIEWHSKW